MSRGPDRTQRSLVAGAAIAAILAALAIGITAGAPEGHWWEFVLLAIGATAGGILEIRIGPGNYISGIFVFSIIAAAFLGPLAAFVTPGIAFLVSGLVHNARRIAILGNCATACLPNVVGALCFQAWLPDDLTSWQLPVTVVAVSLLTWLLNTTSNGAMFAAVDHVALSTKLLPVFRQAPAILLTCGYAGAVASVYAESAAVGMAFAFALMAGFLFMARQTANAIEREQAIGALAESRRVLAADAARAEERERRRIAERLHDGALQDLLAARQDLGSVARGDASRLAVAAETMDTAAAELRATVTELHPSATAAAGTPATLRTIARQAARRGDFSIEVDVPDELHSRDDRLLLGVGRELLANVSRHAQAEHASLRLAVHNGEIVLEVTDDGTGMRQQDREGALAAGHVGLASIVERVEALGGHVEIDSPARDGCGTRITVTVPR